MSVSLLANASRDARAELRSYYRLVKPRRGPRTGVSRAERGRPTSFPSLQRSPQHDRPVRRMLSVSCSAARFEAQPHRGTEAETVAEAVATYRTTTSDHGSRRPSCAMTENPYPSSPSRLAPGRHPIPAVGWRCRVAPERMERFDPRPPGTTRTQGTGPTPSARTVRTAWNPIRPIAKSRRSPATERRANRASPSSRAPGG